MNKEMNLTLGSLFDDSGGFPLGGLFSGITPLWASEIEPFPIRVTTKRFPQVQHLGDISKVSGADIAPVDIITFGSPCTDMSVAGKRAGLDGRQSVLFYQAIRIIKEMRCATNGNYPRCHTKGTWAGKSFELIDWQEQIIRDVFGTIKPNGYRQFNTAYIEIPKKQGKSELAAAVALLLTCGDGEERAEVYGCAADRQQATIVFDVAADMVRMCPALNKRVKILASQKRIIFQPTNSFYQVLSAEAYSKHGFNIHGVVFDELHTQPNRKLFDVMTKGSGDARMQPLYFLITTAGTDTNSICYETHQKAKDILEGRKHDSTFYPVIYGATEEDDWTDPKGFTVVPFGQGFKDMSPPTKELMKLTLEERLAHGGHPVLRWMMDNIFIRTDPAGNIKADKEKSTEKIDGAIATIMSLDRAIRCGAANGASVYDERGILFI